MAHDPSLRHHLDEIVRLIDRDTPRGFGLSIARAYAALDVAEPAAALFRAALDAAPFDLEALTGFADAAGTLGRDAEALALLARGLSRHPKQAPLLHRAARAAARTGAMEEATGYLDRLLEVGAHDPADCLATARALAGAGDRESAERLLSAAVDRRPRHAPLWQQRIGLALQSAAPERALALCDAAAPHLPDQADNLRMRRFQALIALGRSTEVIAEAARTPAAQQHPGTALQLAAAHSSLGQAQAAADVYRAVLDRRPDIERAWIGRIDALRAAEETAQALKCCDAALDALGERAPQILQKKAELLRRAGRSAEAGAILDRVIEAGDTSAHVRLLRARCHIDDGRSEAAEALLREVLAADPHHRGARLTLADLAVARGDTPAARAALTLPEGEAATPDAALLLRLAELLYAAGDFDGLSQTLAALAPLVPSLPTPSLRRLLLAAEKVGDRALAERIFQDVAARPGMDLELGKLLLRAAKGLGDAAFTAAAETGIARRLSPAEAAIFRLDASCLRDGAIKAVRRDRRPGGPCRSAEEVRALAQALVQAGRPALAARYLRRAARVWPDAPWLPRLYATVLLKTGAPEAALDYVETMRGRTAARPLDLAKLEILGHMGAYEAAVAHLESCADRGMPLPESNLLFQAHLCQGDLDRARSAAATALGRIEQSHRFQIHFRSSFLGQLLSELEILTSHWGGLGTTPDRDTAEAFVAAAVRVLRDWRADDDAPRGGEAIPRRIVQYWDKATPPADILMVCDSWRNLPGWTYRRFDRGAAATWLNQVVGATAARAFRRARQPAEQADFLRLCLLAVEGGLYADIDDLRIGDIDALRAQAGEILLFREPYGSIANNLILAAPDHPLIRRAMDMAQAALLRGDNDSVWTKTGPGLLTRAAAGYVLDHPQEAARSVAILPQHALYPIVQPGRPLPYKSTPDYWNAQSETLAAGTRSALRAFADGD